MHCEWLILLWLRGASKDICSFSVASLEQDTYASMLGFYVHFVTIVNRHIFICIADLLTKFAKVNTPEEQGSVSKDEVDNVTQNDINSKYTTDRL